MTITTPTVVKLFDYAYYRIEAIVKTEKGFDIGLVDIESTDGETLWITDLDLKRKSVTVTTGQVVNVQ